MTEYKLRKEELRNYKQPTTATKVQLSLHLLPSAVLQFKSQCRVRLWQISGLMCAIMAVLKHARSYISRPSYRQDCLSHSVIIFRQLSFLLLYIRTLRHI